LGLTYFISSGALVVSLLVPFGLAMTGKPVIVDASEGEFVGISVGAIVGASLGEFVGEGVATSFGGIRGGCI
jgi:hypothetical protein